MNLTTRLLALAAFTMFAAAAAPAAVVICDTANCAPRDSNVLLKNGQTAGTIVGVLHDNPTTEVRFTSESEATLSVVGKGHAAIKSADRDRSFTQMTFELIGGTFSSAVFSLDALANGLVTITVFSPDYSEVLSVRRHGQNYFGVSGGTFTGVRIDSAVALADIGKVRLGGIVPTSAVPEPATWAMMLIGFGAVGYSLRRRPSHRMLQAV